MKTLDLHGVKHSEAYVLVENFVLMNQYRTPIYVVTGNSDVMKKIAIKALEEHDFKWAVNNHNQGEIIVLE